MRRRLIIAFFIALFACITAPTAIAVAPSTDVIPINSTFTPPQLSSACGFTVTRHIEGTLTIRTFYDANGNFVRELDQYNLVETISANGTTLTGRTVQNIIVKVLPDGSYTVAFVGTDFRLPVAGVGIAFGSVGRLVLHFCRRQHVHRRRSRRWKRRGESHRDL
jgi:hypothetical protein